MDTALVFCEKQFGLMDGKTADGLVRHSEKYQIVGVIDSFQAGRDAGEVLDGKPNGIMIFASLDDALRKLSPPPKYLIYGKAPLDGRIPREERSILLQAMEQGINLVCGLFEFLTDDPEFVEKAKACGVTLEDVRKPPALESLHVFSGRIDAVETPVVAVLGTDCACGKMTTTVLVNEALRKEGYRSVMVATGQTGLMLGAKYGTVLDAMPSQFVAGEVEHAVVTAWEKERPDIILIEGQSAVGHPAFLSSIGILKGAKPRAVILQHPPGRKYRCDFPNMPMPAVQSEIETIESFTDTEVIAITLSHENMTGPQIRQTIHQYERTLKLPVTDVLKFGCGKVIEALREKFPELRRKREQKRDRLITWTPLRKTPASNYASANP